MKSKIITIFVIIDYFILFNQFSITSYLMNIIKKNPFNSDYNVISKIRDETLSKHRSKHSEFVPVMHRQMGSTGPQNMISNIKDNQLSEQDFSIIYDYYDPLNNNQIKQQSLEMISHPPTIQIPAEIQSNAINISKNDSSYSKNQVIEDQKTQIDQKINQALKDQTRLQSLLQILKNYQNNKQDKGQKRQIQMNDEQQQQSREKLEQQYENNEEEIESQQFKSFNDIRLDFDQLNQEERYEKEVQKQYCQQLQINNSARSDKKLYQNVQIVSSERIRTITQIRQSRMQNNFCQRDSKVEYKAEFNVFTKNKNKEEFNYLKSNIQNKKSENNFVNNLHISQESISNRQQVFVNKPISIIEIDVNKKRQVKKIMNTEEEIKVFRYRLQQY